MSAYLHWGVLPEGGRTALGAIAGHPDLRAFRLAGGTALALQEGHRASADLDFFVASPRLTLPSLDRFRRDALGGGRGEVRSEAPGTLHATTRGMHLSLLATTSPWVRPARRLAGLRLAHPVDIGLMKLGAAVQRGSRRDFVDLACILDRRISLAALLRLTRRKYPEVRDFVPQALRALVYFADAEREPDPPRLVPEFAWPRVKRSLEAAVRGVADRAFE